MKTPLTTYIRTLAKLHRLKEANPSDKLIQRSIDLVCLQMIRIK
jgi:hypothetical protein